MAQMEEAISIAEAAAASGLGRSTFYKLMASGDGPSTFYVGRRRLVRVESLRHWLADLEAAQVREDNDSVAAI